MNQHYKDSLKRLLSISFIALFALLTTSSNAQTQVWIDENAKWTYDFWNLGVEGTYEFEYTSDTMISGKTCQKIDVTRHRYFTHPLGYPVYIETKDDPRFTYASGDSVFHYSNGQFHLLYDFSASVGDSWIIDITDIGSGCNDTAKVEVVATGTTEINGEELRTITLEPATDSYVTIRSTCVEKFGAKLTSPEDVGTGPFPGYHSCGGSVIDTDILDLRCYSDDTFPAYNTSDVACNHLTGVGSDFLFFENDQRKAFAKTGMADTVYSIAFDTVYEQNNTTWIYENFSTFGDWVDADECEFWGPQECRPLNRPSWLGAPVEYDNNGNYTFYNLEEEAIHIDIALPEGDSALIYEDSEQAFYMKGLGEELTDILDINDTVRSFKILHYNAEGNIINSDLYQHEIVVGKNLGLTSFFRIDHFPDMLIPVQLIGNTEPKAGLTKITNAHLYNYQPGDVIQYKTTESYSGGSPSDNFTRYDKYKYLAREENADSLIYTAELTSFYMDSTTVTTDTVETVHLKNLVIDSIPFGRPEKIEGLLMKNKRLYQEDYCEQILWTYKTDRSDLGYCAADDCWGPQDIFGLPLTDQKEYVFGLGLYSSATNTQQGSQEKSVVYIDKEEYSCGEEVTVGIEEIALFEDYFEIYPNPASSQLNISSFKNIEGSLTIYDTRGRPVKRHEVKKGNNVIQIKHLKSGLYFIKIESVKKTFQSKFVKQ